MTIIVTATSDATANAAALRDAILAASDGETIEVSAGEFDFSALNVQSSLTINKSVNIVGANADTAGSDELGRGAETVFNGGLYVHAEGVTVNGVKVVGGGTNAGNPSGIYIDADDFTFESSILEGDGSTPYGFLTPFGGNVTGLSIDGNLVTGWNQGAYFNPSTGFSITDNEFADNGNHFVGDDWVDGTLIDGNTFEGNTGSAIGYGVYADTDVDVSAFLGDNAFNGPGRPFGIFMYAGGTGNVSQTVTGTDEDDFITAEGTNAGHDIDGGDGNDTIVVGGGNDTVDGGVGSDTIDMRDAGTAGAFVDLGNGQAFGAGIDRFENIENARGSAGADLLNGSDDENTFYATSGDDIIDGRDNWDTLDASTGTDDQTIDFGSGQLASAEFNTSFSSVEAVLTGSGDDTVHVINGDNFVDGGDGFDTLVVDHDDTKDQDDDIGVNWNADDGTFGIGYGWVNDTDNDDGGDNGYVRVANVETVTTNTNTIWLVTDSAGLTAALAAANSGDIIKLADGIYAGNFTIATSGITVESANDDASKVILKGTLRQIAGVDPEDSVVDYVKTHADPAAGTGLTINANDVTIRKITISEYLLGIALGTADNLELAEVEFESNYNAIRKGGASEVTNLNWHGGSVSDGWAGMTAYSSTGGGSLDQINIDGVSFSQLTYKGLYFEQLSNANIHHIQMNDVGQWGNLGTGQFGAGIDINLKHHEYENINISDFDFTDVGGSFYDDGVADPTGAAIVVKARSDSPSYNSAPAEVDGVSISSGTINGTSTGIRIGEPGKPGEAEHVWVGNVDITNAAIADYDNRTSSPLDVELGTTNPDPDQDHFDDVEVASNPEATGPINYHDVSNANTTYTVNEGDSVNEDSSVGIDTVNARGSFELNDNVENLNLLDAGSGIDDLENFDLGGVGPSENGWHAVGLATPTVVVDPDDPTNQVLKISSSTHDGTFGGPYTKDIGVSAGAPSTSAEGDVHIISFRVKPVDAAGDNSRIEVDFGQVAGDDRNNFMAIESLAGGVRVAVNNPTSPTSWVSNDFSFSTGNVTLADGLAADQWLSFELRLRYVDGDDNDVIDVYLNGEHIGTTTTFENLRPSTEEAHQTSRILIRANAGSPTQAPQGDPTQNKGFYFDDLTSTVTTNSNGTGNDLANIINGNSGDNYLEGRGGNDTIDGGAGNDTIDGGNGADSVRGGSGNDWIKVQAGDADSVDGGDGNDTIEVQGRGGDDTVSVVFSGGKLTGVGGSVSNVESVNLDLGGQGAAGDALSYANSTQGVVVDLDAGNASGFDWIDGVENVVGGSGNDQLTGDGGANVLTGGAGNDGIDGGAGNDTAVFSGNFIDYTITAAGPGFSVSRNGEVDFVENVENFKFADRTVASNSSGLITAAPTFVTIPTLSVNENTAIGTLVRSVGATDANSVAGDTLTYALLAAGGGAYTGPFTIDASGNIRVAGALDFEAATSHNFVVSVVDKSGRSKTQAVTVNVGNVNEGIGGLGTKTVQIEAGSTMAPLGTLASVAGATYKVDAIDADGGTVYGGGVALAVGQVLTLAQLNALTINAGSNANLDGSITFTATEGGNTGTLQVVLDVTPAQNGTDTGGAGDDTLDGGDGNDTVSGGAGNDTLLGGAGKDSINGGTGNDSIDGGLGKDSIAGGKGNDVIDGGADKDTIDGGAGNDTIFGGAGNDSLKGYKGNDELHGGTGKDTLDGGAGADKFVFDTALSSSNADLIEGFVHGTDTIVLDADIFAAIGDSLGAGEFRKNSSGNAQDTSDRIIYETDTGELYYDANGSKAGQKVLIAVLDPNISNLSRGDFEIV